MCLSDPVHRRPVNEKYCRHLSKEQLVRYCNQDVNCAEWAYGEESPVSRIALNASFLMANEGKTVKDKLKTVLPSAFFYFASKLTEETTILMKRKFVQLELKLKLHKYLDQLKFLQIGF